MWSGLPRISAPLLLEGPLSPSIVQLRSGNAEPSSDIFARVIFSAFDTVGDKRYGSYVGAWWRRIADWETFSDTEAMRQKAQQISLSDGAFPDPTPAIVNPLVPLNPQKAQAVIVVPPQRPGGSTDPPLDCAIMRPISEDQLDPARAG